ncbi:MAG: cell division protein FtsB [Methylococcaceae bacterium]
MVKLIAFLLVLIAALQYRLWRGDGGIREYYDTRAHIAALKLEAERRRIRNAAIAADVRDLKEGTEAVEELARRELGMIKTGETFVQVYESQDDSEQPASKPPAPAHASHNHPHASPKKQ